MNDVESKIQNLLSSPDGLSQILQVAQNLGLSDVKKDQEEQETSSNSIPKLSGLFDSLNPEQLNTVLSFIEDYQDESDRRFQMLHALREYAKPSDVSHLEKAKQIVKLTKVAKHALHSMRGRNEHV